MGPTVPACDGMVLMDSFLKECQRLHPPSARTSICDHPWKLCMANAIIWILVSAHRVCISDLNLSNGLFAHIHTLLRHLGNTELIKYGMEQVSHSSRVPTLPSQVELSNDPASTMRTPTHSTVSGSSSVQQLEPRTPGWWT